MDKFPPGDAKKAWRAWAKARREDLDLPLLTPLLLAGLTALPEWHNAGNILLYLSLPGELPVEILAEGATKQFYVPRCAPNRQLALHPFVPNETRICTNGFGLREPDPAYTVEVSPEKIDLVIVPALAFDRRGQRLGYGGGYYDRFLLRLRPNAITVGAVPNALLVSRLPSDAYDVPVQILVTEQGTIRQADTTTPIPPPYSD